MERSDAEFAELGNHEHDPIECECELTPEDAPGHPSKRVPRCDNTSVGVLITNQSGRYLMFRRGRAPVGVAPPAGHIDEHGSAEDAARAEVSEEVGLTVTSLTEVASRQRRNVCRRPGGDGHRWTVYRAEVTGDVIPCPDEAKDVRWCSTSEIWALAWRTAMYARGRMTRAEFDADPGIEPVWVAFLAQIIGIPDYYVTADDLTLIDNLAAGRG